MEVLKGLEPERVFFYFEDISKVARGSGNTKGISDHLKDFANRHGLECIQDEKNNLIIFKEGSLGLENASPLILQGHMDMVCAKEKGVSHDFEKEGIELKVEDGMVRAKGTTLGADDGIFLAYAMALLESESIKHPPLEVLITVDEEIGMLGAAYMDLSCLKGRRMINIDSEQEGIFTAGCAGGVRVTDTIPLKRSSVKGRLIEIRVEGLRGGHSGESIHEYRANANIVMSRLLSKVADRINLVDIQGGSADNVIADASMALIMVKEDSSERFSLGDFAGGELEKKLNRILGELKDEAKRIKKEYENTDPAMSVSFEPKENCLLEVMDEESTKRAIAAIYLAPNGVLKMDPYIRGLVKSSLNLGIVRCEKESLSICHLLRSSSDSEKEEMVAKIACLSSCLKGSVSCQGDYSAWEYNKESPLREKMVEVYRDMYGKDPVVNVIHAGVECGVLAKKIPDFDCVSIGPDIKDIHTPKESLDIGSVKRNYEFLLRLLESL
ncbi:MAG: aminoacyl-histidine dipeptidase [Lachnospiraceae bacterium]|nr:aminoacyl-histidine dipeptidase [Lachnospiraceae bacterium]